MSDEQEIENGVEAEEEVNSSPAEGSTGELPLTAKESERQRIQSQVEEFLRRGGQITQVDSNVMSDPPKRPDSNYGGQPI